MVLASITAWLALVAIAPVVAALPILDEGDAVELANRLAEATAEQGICYGWAVRVDDEAGSASGTDAGSNLGPATPVDAASCDRFVVFTAHLRYTSELSESEDSAALSVVSNIAGAPGEADLRAVGITGEALLGDADDVELGDAVLALPALVAARGLAPIVAAEPNTGTIPAADQPTGTPGQSDWLRENGAVVGGGVLLILAGLGWAAWSAFSPSPTTRSPDGPALRPGS